MRVAAISRSLASATISSLLWLSSSSSLLAASACHRGRQPAVEAGSESEGVNVVEPAQLPTPRPADSGLFVTSHTCASCHANSTTATALRDNDGRPIAPYDLWRSSMMANATRDPLFRAVVSAEVARVPAARSAIEAECLQCHAPMAVRDAVGAGEAIAMQDVAADSVRAQLALDGVSCVVCHRMSAARLGEESSFSAHFDLDADGAIFGPYQAPFTRPMQMHTGFTPTYGAHIRDDAGTCGSCHTLVTHAVALDGSIGPPFDEQTPFLEWRASSAARGPTPRTCQSCHLPELDDQGAPISTAVARRPDGSDFPPLDTRTPFGRHTLVGGNTLIPALLRDEPALGSDVPAAAFDATINAARAQLNSGVSLTVTAAGVTPQARVFDVEVANHAGHKLPTGYPSRRLVLHVRALDASGGVLLDSGRIDAAGRVVDADGAPIASELAGGPVEPHRDVLRAGEVQIWEPVLGDEAGVRTGSLLAAVRLLKDNRILPDGFDASSTDGARVAPVAIGSDDDFRAGADTIHVQVPRGTARVEVELLYQVLSGRFLADLATADTVEVRALQTMLARGPLPYEVIATATSE